MASYTRVDAVRDRVAELDMLRCSFTGPDHVHMGTSEADEAGLRSWSDVRDSADDDAVCERGCVDPCVRACVRACACMCVCVS